MSTLNVSNITDGTNTFTPEQGAKGTAKAWVNFNGEGTVAIRTSHNVSSITDLGTGVYRVNMNVPMVDANYLVFAGDFIETTGSYNDHIQISGEDAKLNSSYILRFRNGGSYRDPAVIETVVFR